MAYLQGDTLLKLPFLRGGHQEPGRHPSELWHANTG
jgi:hypothetical protein